MRRLALAAVVVALLAPPAAAHLDVPVGDGSERFTLASGESRAFAFEVHYHRLVGRVVVEGDAPVRLALFRGEASEAFWTREPLRGASGLNLLVDCCDDGSYAPFRLVVAHAGGGGVADVRLDAKMAHDDLLVGLSGAEGDVVQNSALFWVIGGVLAHRVVRSARRPAASTADAQRHLRRSALAFAAPFALWGAAAAWGATRYGGGLAEGAVAAFAALAPHFGAALLVLALATAWTTAAVCWTRAYADALHGGVAARRVALVGAAMALALAASPLLLVPAYGTRVLTIGLVMPLPVAVVLAGAAAHLVVRARVAGSEGGPPPPPA